MEAEKIQTVAFEIILNSGDARTLVHEGFKNMRNGEYQKAKLQLEEANAPLV